MQSVVSVRGQTVIPKEIREKLGIHAKSRLRWEVRDGRLIVSILPEDSIAALRGVLKDSDWSTADLLAERKADREKEEQAVEETLRRWRSTSSTPRR
jgi:AbrB family looped-hinge helix DNA binding protein